MYPATYLPGYREVLVPVTSTLFGAWWMVNPHTPTHRAPQLNSVWLQLARRCCSDGVPSCPLGRAPVAVVPTQRTRWMEAAASVQPTPIPALPSPTSRTPTPQPRPCNPAHHPAPYSVRVVVTVPLSPQIKQGIKQLQQRQALPVFLSDGSCNGCTIQGG